MKRLIIISSLAVALFVAPIITPTNSFMSIEAAVRVVSSNKTAVCFDGGTRTKQVRVNFDKDGNPDFATMQGERCNIYRCSDEAPDGRRYQYYFQFGNEIWYFNL